MRIYGSIEVKSENPFQLFDEWYTDAAKGVTGDSSAMVLSTAGSDGIVSSRVVLLKNYSEEGFTFFTNYNSHKGIQLAANSYASLLFYWPHRGRQVRIEGRAVKISAAESDDYFNSRPAGSRLGAWASEQSRVIRSTDEVLNRFNQLQQEFGANIPRPSHWGGYRLLPLLFEFWQEGENRLHNRLRWRRKGEEWHPEMLAP